MEDDVDGIEKEFHSVLRELIIGFLVFLILSVTSYAILSAFKRRPDRDEYSVASEDAFVYKVSILFCTFTLAVSFGAVFLLPISIIANEAILSFPNSYYLQWVNSSLIYGLWNSIFFCSNLSLFVLMPFSYLFTESEGLPGSKRGIWPRVYETILVFFLLCLAICGLAWVVLAIISDEKISFFSEVLFNVKNFYFLYLYSYVSFVGVAMLLIGTPFGFITLFQVIGGWIRKPDYLEETFENDLDSGLLNEEYFRIKNNYHKINFFFDDEEEEEEEDEKIEFEIKEKKNKDENKNLYLRKNKNKTIFKIIENENNSLNHSISSLNFQLPGKKKKKINLNSSLPQFSLKKSKSFKKFPLPHHSLPQNSNYISSYLKKREELENKIKNIYYRRKIFHPIAMILLFFLMSTTLLLVSCNIGELILTNKNFRYKPPTLVLGVSSLSFLGPVGAFFEIIVIFYLISTSIVGIYSLPGFNRLKLKRKDTPMTIIITNCVTFLLLSSALPLLSRTLGITNFNLLGNYSQLEWLKNSFLILTYNIIFVIVTAIILTNKISNYVGKSFFKPLIGWPLSQSETISLTTHTTSLVKTD